MEIKGPNSITPVPAAGTVTSSSPAASTSTTLPHASRTDTVQLSGLLALLQAGQRLEVIVAALEGKQLVLQLPTPLLDQQGNRAWIQLRAPANLPVQIGQKLQLEVVDPNPALPVLKLTTASALPLTVQAALNNALAQQQPATPFYASVAQLNQPALRQQLEKMPAPVRMLLETIWRQLPEPEQLRTAATLKQALQHAGVFLEANLLASAVTERATPPLDLRLSLLRLAAALRDYATAAPPPLAHHSATHNDKPLAAAPHPQLPQPQARQEAKLPAIATTDLLLEHLALLTDSTLARQHTQQLQMLTTEATRPGWALELPMRQGDGVDLFDLRIHQDGKGQANDPAQHDWTVMLAFDLDGLGPMRVQLSLRGNVLSTYWWAEQSDTVKLFHEHMETLRTRITAAGLTLEQLRCQTSTTTTTHTPKPTGYAAANIDERI